MTNLVNKMRSITVRSYNMTATGESHDKTFPIFLQESNFQIRHVVQILVHSVLRLTRAFSSCPKFSKYLTKFISRIY